MSQDIPSPLHGGFVMLHDGERWVCFQTAINSELGFRLEIASTCAGERRMLEMYVVEYFRIAGAEKGMEDLLWCLLIAQTVSLQDLICASIFTHMPYHVTLVNTEHLQQWP